MVEPTTVLIADDHPLFRAGVRQSLDRQAAVKVIAEADNGEDALAKILDLKPDVAILDIQMPKLTGLELAKKAETLGLSTRIILLTMVDDRKVFLDAMESGVVGYVLKDSAVSEIGRAIATVADDRHYISPSLSGLLVERRKGGSLPPSVKDLTPTEIRIVKLIADLKSNQEIADEMAISRRTVENHRVNISRKLNLTGSNALLKFALKNKADL
ncbi:MAG TPA: response regulator transcription factor [Bacteroidota bacterium]|nr:response regulator transcription factor [Bacteroidota bacterium]